MGKSADIVNRFYEAWNKKDLNAMENLLTDNTVYEGPLITWKGKKEYLEGVKELLPVFNGLNVIKQFEDAKIVCSIMDIHMNTPEGPVTIHSVDLVELSNDHISKSRAYNDPRKIEKYCKPA